VISTTPSAVGAGILSASVTTTDTDERASNNQDSQQLTVNPAVDLVASASVPTSVLIDSSTTVTATLQNLSILPATNVSLSVSLGPGLRVDAASWTMGACAVTGQQVDCQAIGLDAQSSSALTITATAVSTGRQNVTVSLSSAEADANPGNNNASGTVNVTDPQAEDSGGGTMNPLFLLMMVLVGLLRRRMSC
jgi:hypothetical protein